MSDSESLPFPVGHGSVTITTRDRRAVRIRHIAPEDAALLVDLYEQLSPETRRLRFFAPKPDLPDEVLWREAVRLSAIDPLVQAALIGTVQEAGRERAIGVARLVRDAADPTTAEVAIVVRDDYQGQGIGKTLFDLLIQVAMVRGLKRLRAIALAENRAAQRLVRSLGLPVTSSTLRGETTMIISLLDS
jgi:GNAT superfamily N-acetyltransferase